MVGLTSSRLKGSGLSFLLDILIGHPFTTQNFQNLPSVDVSCYCCHRFKNKCQPLLSTCTLNWSVVILGYSCSIGSILFISIYSCVMHLLSYNFWFVPLYFGSFWSVPLCFCLCFWSNTWISTYESYMYKFQSEFLIPQIIFFSIFSLLVWMVKGKMLW